ncbi:uncharacterized protein LOC112504142 [Cynara cardunculus var. scolymus]|uniref:uncharacterized protein LOC112504142 n=1 Tax=Cynara cardunculus var. scolymus TaxID=59895 RepID=UPI000D628DFE|nr:uncharacterized protein LOC112504142 [Cynara cardunculus var. scolymus]
MSHGDAASHTPPNPDDGENNPDPNLNEDDTPLSLRSERLMKPLSIFVQQTFEQFKHDTGKERALTWWDATFESLTEDERESLTWESFKTRFFEQFCPIDLQRMFEKEFLELKQGNMSVIEYETQFNRKARFALRFLSSKHERIEHFVDGLRREIREFVANRDIPSFNKVVEYVRRREHDLTIFDEPNFEPKRQRNERTFSVPTQRQSRSFTPRRSQSQNIPRAQSQAYSLQV